MLSNVAGAKQSNGNRIYGLSCFLNGEKSKPVPAHNDENIRNRRAEKNG
jgi:hypothetical protein